MPRLSLGLNQRNFNGTRATSAAAINMGAMRGKGSTSRMLNFCKTHSQAPSLCIDQFINITGGGSGDVVPESRVPVAPFITSILPGDQELIVNFYEVNDGGSPITNYLYSTNNGITFTSYGLTLSPLTIAGLMNGTTYHVRIKAVNSIGQSAESNLVSETPFLGTVPGAPFITSVNVGDRELIVNFIAPNNGGSPITDYLYSIDASGNIDPSGNTFISSGLNSSPIVISNLGNNITYPVAIKAVNSFGTGNASNIVNGTPTSANQGWSELGATAPVPFTSLYTNTGAVRVVNYNQTLNKVYAAGDFTNSTGYNFVAVYDISNNTWQELGNINSIIVTTGSIRALIFDTSNNLYIGGYFTNSSGYKFVAKYTNSTEAWTEVGNLAGDTAMTVNGHINCLNSDGQNRIYAAGNFQYTDGNGNWRYVARYTPNTTTWDRLPTSEYNIGGQQFNGELYAISSFDTSQGTYIRVAGDAIATTGGGFDNPVGVRRVWSYLDDFGIFYADGAGEWPTSSGGNPQMYMFNGPVYALSDQFAGGAFTSDPNRESTTTNNYILAQAQWRPFPLTSNGTFSGITYNGPIRTITNGGGYPYIAGDFTDSSGNYYVANSQTGYSVGNDNTIFNDSILSIRLSASLDVVYAGGNFTNSSGKNFVAIHDP